MKSKWRKLGVGVDVCLTHHFPFGVECYLQASLCTYRDQRTPP